MLRAEAAEAARLASNEASLAAAQAVYQAAAASEAQRAQYAAALDMATARHKAEVFSIKAANAEQRNALELAHRGALADAEQAAADRQVCSPPQPEPACTLGQMCSCTFVRSIMMIENEALPPLQLRSVQCLQAARDAELRMEASNATAQLAAEHCKAVAAITSQFRREASALKEEAAIMRNR